MKHGILDALHGNQPKLSVLPGVHHLAGRENMPGGSRQGGNHQKADPHTTQGAEQDLLMPKQIRKPDEEKENRQPQPLGDAPLQEPGTYPGVLGQVEFQIRGRRFLGSLTGPGGPLQEFLRLLSLTEHGSPGTQSCR